MVARFLFYVLFVINADRICKLKLLAQFFVLLFVNNFLNLKIETCTTISHAPQKANVTEAGKGQCLSEVCKELQ